MKHHILFIILLMGFLFSNCSVQKKLSTTIPSGEIIPITENVMSKTSNETTVTDIEGNIYPVVIISNKLWMASNLKVSKYNTGTPLLQYSGGGFLKPEGLKSSRLVEPGDFLLTNSMSFGRPYIMKTTGCIHDGWLLIRYNKKFIDQDYLYSMLSSTYIYNSFKETAQGGVVQNLNIDKARATIIPIPPLHEQKAIFQKVEILMERCRTLELEITQSEEMSQSLLQSLFVNVFQS